MKMSLKDFNMYVMNLHARVSTNNSHQIPTEEIMVEFHLTDREGMNHNADDVEKMVYDVLDPKKVHIYLS